MKLIVKRQYSWFLHQFGAINDKALIPWLSLPLLTLKAGKESSMSYLTPIPSSYISEFLTKAADYATHAPSFRWNTTEQYWLPSLFFLTDKGAYVPYSVESVKSVLFVDYNIPLLGVGDGIHPDCTNSPFLVGAQLPRTMFLTEPSTLIQSAFMVTSNNNQVDIKTGWIPNLSYTILPDGSTQIINRQQSVHYSGPIDIFESAVSGIVNPGTGGFIDVIPFLTATIKPFDKYSLSNSPHISGLSVVTVYEQTFFIEVGQSETQLLDDTLLCAKLGYRTYGAFSAFLSSDNRYLSSFTGPDPVSNGKMVSIWLRNLQINRPISVGEINQCNTWVSTNRVDLGQVTLNNYVRTSIALNDYYTNML